MDEATWNVLHDGRLIAAEGAVPGDVTLAVEVAYLCGHLPTAAGYLLVMLAGCDWCEYRTHDKPPAAGPAAVAALGLTILTAGADGETVSVECADGSYGGQVLLRYAAAEVRTAEGRPLSQPELESAAGRYWAMWERRHAGPGAGAGSGE